MPKAICVPHVAIIVSRYLHQLFLPDSALYKNAIFDMTIPPIRKYENLYLNIKISVI